ncbi:hypothetical protein ACFLYU_03090 [Candidatus Dependentiae bacterium]
MANFKKKITLLAITLLVSFTGSSFCMKKKPVKNNSKKTCKKLEKKEYKSERRKFNKKVKRTLINGGAYSPKGEALSHLTQALFFGVIVFVPILLLLKK